jgi:hypothetical protein
LGRALGSTRGVVAARGRSWEATSVVTSFPGAARAVSTRGAHVAASAATAAAAARLAFFAASLR